MRRVTLPRATVIMPSSDSSSLSLSEPCAPTVLCSGSGPGSSLSVQRRPGPVLIHSVNRFEGDGPGPTQNQIHGAICVIYEFHPTREPLVRYNRRYDVNPSIIKLTYRRIKYTSRTTVRFLHG